ncbi:nucleotidyltransferase family protein [Gracilibacillus timonensis]|uniref:nucleotidyltransferase family protein n=1 Tax=Gracilibacillus timonensis TaxID=1816696 RepID=UPI000826CFB3|nr:nucleotidyltransferase family protein [Gracilibacillus timonensis]
MKCIILAAGYATRLYPLTKNKAKPLLEIGGKPLINHIMEKIEPIDSIDRVYVVTNQKFAASFEEWAKDSAWQKPLTIVNDETTSNQDRLGAIGDIAYVINQQQIKDDTMVLAGDNLFDFDLTDFVQFYQSAQTDCITYHKLEDKEALQQIGVMTLNEQGEVQTFEEKPKVPKSNLAVPPFYIYQQSTLPLLRQYIREDNNPDAPGNFIPWLIKHRPVQAFPLAEACYDIGTLESYRKVQSLF